MDMNKIGFQMSPEEVFKSGKDLNYFTVNSLTWEPSMGDSLRSNQAQDLFKVGRAGQGPGMWLLRCCTSVFCHPGSELMCGRCVVSPASRCAAWTMAWHGMASPIH